MKLVLIYISNHWIYAHLHMSISRDIFLKMDCFIRVSFSFCFHTITNHVSCISSSNKCSRTSTMIRICHPFSIEWNGLICGSDTWDWERLIIDFHIKIEGLDETLHLLFPWFIYSILFLCNSFQFILSTALITWLVADGIIGNKLKQTPTQSMNIYMFLEMDILPSKNIS